MPAGWPLERMTAVWLPDAHGGSSAREVRTFVLRLPVHRICEPQAERHVSESMADPRKYASVSKIHHQLDSRGGSCRAPGACGIAAVGPLLGLVCACHRCTAPTPFCQLMPSEVNPTRSGLGPECSAKPGNSCPQHSAEVASTVRLLVDRGFGNSRSGSKSSEPEARTRREIETVLQCLMQRLLSAMFCLHSFSALS